jgi:hypothetical protein
MTEMNPVEITDGRYAAPVSPIDVQPSAYEFHGANPG